MSSTILVYTGGCHGNRDVQPQILSWFSQVCGRNWRLIRIKYREYWCLLIKLHKFDFFSPFSSSILMLKLKISVIKIGRKRILMHSFFDLFLFVWFISLIGNMKVYRILANYFFFTNIVISHVHLIMKIILSVDF